MTGAGGAQNLLLQPLSAGRHSSADPTDWAGSWVCVGFAEQLNEVGAVLPATIGYHGAHVCRTGAGLVAAMNARPFGGCMSVPVHCASTRNVACPHLACAFSADGGVLDSHTDPRGRARTEFLGDGRRTVELPLAQWGSLLFVNVTVTEPVPLPIADTATPDHLVAAGIGSQLVSGNWLVTPGRAGRAVAQAVGAADTQVTAVAPNLTMVQYGTDTVAVVSRPAGHTRSTLLWASMRGPGDSPVLDETRLADVLTHALR